MEAVKRSMNDFLRILLFREDFPSRKQTPETVKEKTDAFYYWKN